MATIIDPKTTSAEQDWKSTACMLCSIGCALEVQVNDTHITKIRGDKSAASSQGYLCQKAGRIDHYQNHSERLSKPLRKNGQGTFEEVEWSDIIPEIATKMNTIKADHGGHAFAYYGGGGQGNHLGGTYSSALRAALDTPYVYTALAQEKTGDFWINGQLFGRQSCFVVEGMEDADYSIVLGANPWAAHGIPKTREMLKGYQKNAERTLVVIDPRLSETAKMADIHLAVKPGQDAFLLSAMIAVILQEGLEDKDFIARHTHGFETLKEQFISINVADYAKQSGVEETLIRQVAMGFAKAKKATVRADLGIQQSLHSTLNSYLEKLLFLVTGNFNKKGGNHLMSQFAPLIGHSKEPEEGGPVTRVTGMKGISKLFPPNILPLEVDTDHPERVRALIVDSANPVLSAANKQAYERAFKKLELSVVIDVALTETARLADYVLPASSQFEKVECAFFTFGFPTPYFHLRKPLFNPTGDTLPEAEIYRRLVVAMGELPDRFPALEKLAKLDKALPFTKAFPLALAASIKLNPKWANYAPLILYSTIGKQLPESMQSAATLWAVSQFYAAKFSKQIARAGIHGKPYQQGKALFAKMLESDKPIALATFDYEDTWQWMKTKDKKVRLAVPEMFAELSALENELTQQNEKSDFPFVLMAGERRAYNANQIFRTPDWRKTDKDGAMHIHPADLAKLSLNDGDKALCRSKVGQVEVLLKADDTVQEGMLTLPHGYGQLYTNAEGVLQQNGPAINELTATEHCDPIAKTPYHKHVSVALSAVA
ncbi:MAG: molybdopterin-dependent oxidoreductase [Oleiphilus sp.]